MSGKDRPTPTQEPSFVELFTPKLVTVLREGYHLTDLRADAISGLTVAIVALPLSMAIAIASGTTPDRGLFTAIVGGFIISLLGGSRFQIGGPAGAFIVLVAAAVTQIGIDGLLLATMIAGAILIGAGLLRLGTYIKFIPYPVTVGFTAGIAVIVFASQIKDLLGLTLAHEPAELLPKLEALAGAMGTLNWAAIAVAIFSIGTITGLRKYLPRWPGMLIAVVAASLLATQLHLPVATIASKFGGIPRTLPMPAIPPISLEKLQQALPFALSFALLGAIESLLSAVVADGMTGRRHRSNSELVAQGIANIASAMFGGICATGTIARTATNVRAGAKGPISGILHSVFLLLLMLIAAPLAGYIPLAALAGVLTVVAWNMTEKPAFAALLRNRGDAVVLLATFLLTTFRDLTTGIVVGFSIAALLFINRMAKSAEVQTGQKNTIDDMADTDRDRGDYDSALASDPDILVYRISGALFFGAAASVSTVLDRIGDHHRALIIDLSAVEILDSTAANAVAGVTRNAGRRAVAVFITGASPTVRHELFTHGVRPPLADFRTSIADAVVDARTKMAVLDNPAEL